MWASALQVSVQLYFFPAPRSLTDENSEMQIAMCHNANSEMQIAMLRNANSDVVLSVSFLLTTTIFSGLTL